MEWKKQESVRQKNKQEILLLCSRHKIVGTWILKGIFDKS
jgi:hypothetical protein